MLVSLFLDTPIPSLVTSGRGGLVVGPGAKPAPGVEARAGSRAAGGGELVQVRIPAAGESGSTTVEVRRRAAYSTPGDNSEEARAADARFRVGGVFYGLPNSKRIVISQWVDSQRVKLSAPEDKALLS